MMASATREIVGISPFDAIGITYTYSSYHMSDFNLRALFTDKFIVFFVCPGSTGCRSCWSSVTHIWWLSNAGSHANNSNCKQVYDTGSIFHLNAAIAEKESSGPSPLILPRSLRFWPAVTLIMSSSMAKIAYELDG